MPKNLIVLHFTAGTTARSAFNTWVADPLRIATAYIVDGDGSLCRWPNAFKTRWCHVDETHKYVESTHRGMHYYARFPDIQFLSVCNLVKYLCDRFEIDRQIPEDKLDVCDLDWFTDYTGIASHQNFRNDKYDIGPAFAWERFRELIA